MPLALRHVLFHDKRVRRHFAVFVQLVVRFAALFVFRFEATIRADVVAENRIFMAMGAFLYLLHVFFTGMILEIFSCEGILLNERIFT